MVAADGASNYAQRLGIEQGQVVQELGWDTDTDDDIRADIEDACGGELLDEDADEVIDVVLLWWRDDDGDLVDALMDAITPLADDGVIWVLTPKTGKPGKPVLVDDPYNMYATPDGKSAIVVAEARKRLDFRDPKTMALQYSIDVPGCPGVNHADFSIDGRFAIFTCEFSGTVVKIDLEQRKVLGYLQLQMPATRLKEKPGAARAQAGQVWEPGESEVCTVKKGMPQDIRISPDGKRFYVADMHADGVHVIDGESFKEVGFVQTGLGAHGLYPSRDGKQLYVANRGSHKIHGSRLGDGGVTVIDFATEKVVARWAVPGGGSPDMGNVSADGKYIWLSGRYDDVVYRVETTTGAVDQVKVGREPHGLTVWPQPGRYSTGHTGVMR